MLYTELCNEALESSIEFSRENESIDDLLKRLFKLGSHFSREEYICVLSNDLFSSNKNSFLFTCFFLRDCTIEKRQNEQAYFEFKGMPFYHGCLRYNDLCNRWEIHT